MSILAINHYTGVRIRVEGEGELELSLVALGGSPTKTLTPIDMEATTNKTPTKLTNFMQQKAQLVGQTTEFEAHFVIRQIAIYIKPVFTSYPQ